MSQVYQNKTWKQYVKAPPMPQWKLCDMKLLILLLAYTSWAKEMIDKKMNTTVYLACAYAHNTEA